MQWLAPRKTKTSCWKEKRNTRLCGAAAKLCMVLAMQTPTRSLRKVNIYLCGQERPRRGDGKRESMGGGEMGCRWERHFSSCAFLYYFHVRTMGVIFLNLKNLFNENYFTICHRLFNSWFPYKCGFFSSFSSSEIKTQSAGLFTWYQTNRPWCQPHI